MSCSRVVVAAVLYTHSKAEERLLEAASIPHLTWSKASTCAVEMVKSWPLQPQALIQPLTADREPCSSAENSGSLVHEGEHAFTCFHLAFFSGLKHATPCTSQTGPLPLFFCSSHLLLPLLSQPGGVSQCLCQSLRCCHQCSSASVSLLLCIWA